MAKYLDYDGLKKVWGRIKNYFGPKYATCSTARSVVAKVVAYDGFVLQTGARITVKFTNTNNTSPTSGDITLNVNNTGAKNVYLGKVASALTQMKYSHSHYFYNNEVMDFVYDGTNWIIMGGYDSNTNIDTKVTQSAASADKWRPVLMGWQNTDDKATEITSYTDTVYGNIKFQANPSTGEMTATKFIGNLEGTADAASKLGTDTVGSATQPVYLNAGTPTVCTYTLGASVPSDAVFTDTNTYVTQSSSTTSNWRNILLGYTSSAAYNTAVTKVTKQSYITTGISVQSSTCTISAGRLLLNPTSASYAQGVRINKASDGWALIQLGGTTGTATGTEAGAWTIGRRGMAAANGYGQIGDLLIQSNGSDGATGVTISAEGSVIANGNVITKGSVKVGSTLTSNNITDGCTMTYNSTSKCMEFTFS